MIYSKKRRILRYITEQLNNVILDKAADCQHNNAMFFIFTQTIQQLLTSY